MNAASDEYAFERPATKHDVVVGLAEIANNAVSTSAVRGRLLRRSLADDAESVRVVDVEDRLVVAGERRVCAEIGGVPGHAVHPVDADQPRGRLVGAQQALELVEVVVRETFQRRAAQRGELGALVDRLVGPSIDEDAAARREQRDHGEVDERDRRQDEDVVGREKAREPLLDLLVEHGAAEQPRPAGMGSPRLEVGRDGLDDLAVEIEPEVVARGEVGEPVVADPDHPAVDLVDHGVGHRARALELGQVGARVEPATYPVVIRAPMLPG